MEQLDMSQALALAAASVLGSAALLACTASVLGSVRCTTSAVRSCPEDQKDRELTVAHEGQRFLHLLRAAVLRFI